MGQGVSESDRMSHVNSHSDHDGIQLKSYARPGQVTIPVQPAAIVAPESVIGQLGDKAVEVVQDPSSAEAMETSSLVNDELQGPVGSDLKAHMPSSNFVKDHSRWSPFPSPPTGVHIFMLFWGQVGAISTERAHELSSARCSGDCLRRGAASSTSTPVFSK